MAMRQSAKGEVTKLGMVITNAIDQSAFDLQSAPFSQATDISNDYLLDNIEFNFSSAESKTITVTTAQGTELYNSTNTTQHIYLKQADIGGAFNGGENITVAVTQTSGACSMDCVLKIRQGSNTLQGNPSLSTSSDIIGRVKTVDESGNNSLSNYKINDMDDDSDPAYFGFTTASGEWFILKIDEANKTFRYTKGDTSYLTNWTGRTGLSYNTYDNIF